MSYKNFWYQLWNKLSEEEDENFFFDVRTLWKKTQADNQQTQYHEKKIRDTIYCVRGICEGEKEINHTIETIAIRNAHK